MSTSRHFDKICAVISVLALLLTVLFMNGEDLGLQKVIDEDAETGEASVYFSSRDLDGGWDDTDATVITLNGDSVKVSGGGAYANGGSVYISSGGYYVLSGTLTDGNITVDAYASSKVYLKLAGVTVNCTDDACLRVDQADKVFLTLAEGTENSFTSGGSMSDDASADNTNGAIFAHDDLTINGNGALTITAGYRHGITAKDDLRITGGTIRVTAPADGLHVNDSFNFANASLTIDAGDDAIHSDTAVYIESGTILVEDCYEGIEALTIDIAGGDITIYPGDDGLNANGGSGGFGFGGMGGRGNFGEGFGSADNGGSSGEGFGSADNGGSSGDDFGRADNGDGSDRQTQSDSAQKEQANASAGDTDSETWVHISGGTLTIITENAQDADGIDSNGDILISGGTIRVSLVGSGSNSALDYGSESGGVMEISGGTVIACGASSMAESFDSTSTQASILYNTSTTTEAGTTVALEDADGNVLLTWDVPCSFSSMAMSSPEMQIGNAYLVVVGDNVEEITLEEVSASYGDAQSGGFGGNMHWGGMQDRDSFVRSRGGDNAETENGGFDGRGRGGFGGRGSFGDSDGEMPDREELAEMAENGEFQFPDMEKFEEMMESGELPTPPEMGDWDGKNAENGDMGFAGGGNGGMGFPGEEETSGAANTSTGGTALTDYGTDIWIPLGASAAALLAAIGLAIRFKRRGG